MIDNVLNNLDKVKTIGNGKYKACCPAHDDSNPSLSITEKGDKILFKCWAGCSTQDILDSTGLTWNDLFLKPLTNEQRSQRKQALTESELNTERLVLEIARQDREKGYKLSQQDLQREQEAWHRVNG